ncbi:ATP-binding SpoIIE family protein phosphatase [Blastococcus sp. PRF04-17]|uniref:ATP-binding SpoIIE family protein phosphatase n=1 Tax=Blastococcus sp. PRF04-17 TaxID=2933797 RepID=UPI001FF489D7|nr:ATP-binding SpoIIE family protein phosphatase [Blastococcus sp. PRF04-17]UOY02391.1 SpoIIE family protein phosphatase [Blastococcus sp. PRF04-17]
MTDVLWQRRPRPRPGSPVLVGWRGEPTTAAEVRGLRMQLRTLLSGRTRPPGATDDDVDRLLLAFEELVSNGLRHGRAPVHVSLTETGGGWLLEVSDAAGDTPPVPAVGRDAAHGGLGLYLVASLSGAHGWTTADNGRKVVWARVDFSGDEPSQERPAPVAGPELRIRRAVPPAAVAPAAAPPVARAPAASQRPARLRPSRLSVLATAVVLLVALALAWLASSVNARTNQQLLEQQVAQAGAVLTTQVAVIQTQLADAGEVAQATDGRPAPFINFASGTVPGEAMSLSLWRVRGERAERLAAHGPDPLLPSDGADAFLSGVQPTGQLTSAGILSGEPPRLAYALRPADEEEGLVVYAEVPLRREVQVEQGEAFGGLDLAVYLGPDADPDRLVQATAETPIDGDTATTQVPFGDDVLTVIAASRTPLTGSLAAALPWIVLGVGGALALVSGATAETLFRRRAVAEQLAADNEQLYRQQRGIASSLQHALLPQVVPVAGMELAARYVAGVDELEVGGDWYDVIEGAEGRSVFVVGDVSGRGLPAATTMAALRFAVRAYVAQGDGIETVLTKLRPLLDVSVDHQFATVLLGEVDPAAGVVRLVSAGHFGPLLLAEGRAEFVECTVAPPVGVPTPLPPSVTEVRVEGPSTLLAFTDGAVERRGEVVDTGLERLRSTAAAAAEHPLAELLDRLMQMPIAGGGRDDTVILGVRWPGA